MRKNNKGSVFTEYVVVMLALSLGVYFALVGNSGEPDPTPSGVQPLVEAVHERQQSFVDSVLAP